MQKHWLSILTPVYNGANFIAGCMQNVIDQGIDGIEHIIYDGQSTDTTASIVSEFSKKFPHIRFFSEKDSGQSNAMNKAIIQAKAPIIGFLNADDFYEPNALKSFFEIAKPLSNAPTMWIGSCKVRDANNTIIGINKPKAKNIYQLIAGFEPPYNASAYFYHKILHDTIGPYDENDHYTMDLDFLLKAYSHSEIQICPEIWGNFRMMEGTKTFTDAANGNMFARCDRLKNNAYQRLNAFEKTIVCGYKTEKKLVDYFKRQFSKIK